ncbi:hypothetical protein ACFFIO_15380 [Citricoccus parietis]|uniref:Uncharacterized protein n=1 Tax=Citricoccus parietis TaxID=592307 RepID=A0ABV6F8Q0_9MICC
MAIDTAVQAPPRLAESLTEVTPTALEQQTVIIAGTEAATTVIPIPRRTADRADGSTGRGVVAGQRPDGGDPLSPILSSKAGARVRTASRILTELVGNDFTNTGHLASYAGMATVTRRSRISIRGNQAPVVGAST